jgi:hypothetical protein
LFGPIRLHFLELEFKLLDLPVQFLRRAAERHAAQLGEHALEAFDVGVARIGLLMTTSEQVFVYF